MNVWAVGIGGFLGAIIRYSVGKVIPPVNGFPIGTLGINLVGCLFLAWFFTRTTRRWRVHQSIKIGIGTGCIGAFTTFSTFSVETYQLIQHHQYLLAILYIFLSVCGGIGLAFLGARFGALF